MVDQGGHRRRRPPISGQAVPSAGPRDQPGDFDAANMVANGRRPVWTSVVDQIAVYDQGVMLGSRNTTRHQAGAAGATGATENAGDP